MVSKGLGSGWHFESNRHALASKGIKTGSAKSLMLIPIPKSKLTKERYEYVYAKDVFDDDNDGLLYGVEDTQGGDYVEWFPSIKKLEDNTLKFGLNVNNREMFIKSLGEK